MALPCACGFLSDTGLARVKLPPPLASPPLAMAQGRGYTGSQTNLIMVLPHVLAPCGHTANLHLAGQISVS